MPKGNKKTWMAHPEAMRLVARCLCGKEYVGKAGQTNYLFDLHRKICDKAPKAEELVLGVAACDEKDRLLGTTKPKTHAALTKAISRYTGPRGDIAAFCGRNPATVQECLHSLR